LFFRIIYYGSFVVAGALLVRSGLQFVDVTGDRKGTAVDLPLRVPMLAIPVAALLLCLQGARALANLRSEMRAVAAGEDESIEIGL
jgi:TRAP-type C4-dicarboxylate transport system permease small subunit